ncbi:ArsR/SmtB family transcription factor [Nocardioides speluncae]|uniref:ArsR/SmtB family transcription factor n=1 Tax=Nocardioides speluncae TaxID=2670337 RepID=UPI000D68D7DC|nr:winged helix-turn-helix domain-containing protein [Nocardioides speluncae]
MAVSPTSLAAFAALLADPTRSAICLALLDGRAWTAGEIAAEVGVARSTASEQLTTLVGAGLLAEERQRRHRYVRLSGHQIATVIEDLAGLAGAPEVPRSLRESHRARDLAAARTCYDHLAGALGVGLYDAFVDRGLLTTADGTALTAAGRSWFTELLGEPALTARGRPLIRTCLDWTERRPHLAGALGAALHHGLRERGWVVAGPRPRAVRLTEAGAHGLEELLGRPMLPSTGDRGVEGDGHAGALAGWGREASA